MHALCVTLFKNDFTNKYLNFWFVQLQATASRQGCPEPSLDRTVEHKHRTNRHQKQTETVCYKKTLDQSGQHNNRSAANGSENRLKTQI